MIITQQNRYSFSGHETFPCKTLWLKKGYDFIINGCDFNSPEAVMQLGVGKNMVTAIRYWLRAFGMSKNDKPTELANYIFNTKDGKDPYIEDLGTLWLLHFLLVSKCEATIYNWMFVRLQKERKTFDRQQVVNFVHRILIEDNKQYVFNENTIKTDIGVLLQNYVLPVKPKTLDDYGNLLIDLDLIRAFDDKNCHFNIEGKRHIPWQIFLFAIVVTKNTENTVSYDTLQDIGLMFCMTDMEVIETCMLIEAKHPNEIRYSDTAGIKQLQFIKNITSEEVLNEYYN